MSSGSRRCGSIGRWRCPVGDRLAALRRELHELECRAENADGDDLAVLHLEAAEVEERIKVLELADGNARSFPMDGRVAA